jgi:putative tryptophan/tyrosine transport system substrate-binding protein
MSLLSERAEMKRREFLAFLGCTAAWPVLARAQQGGKMRRIGALIGYAQDDPLTIARVAAFVEGLEQLGWTRGRNVEIDFRYAGGDIDQARIGAKDLVALKPEVILANTTPAAVELSRQTRTIPIVFVIVSDPVGSGLVESLSKPGRNITGFINVEASMGGKWVELLKDALPSLSRVTMIFNPETAPYAEYYQQSFRAAAGALSLEARVVPVRSSEDIEREIQTLGRTPGSALIGIPDSFLLVHRKNIIDLTLRFRIPTVFGFPDSGGLLQYAPDPLDLFRRSSSYIDRILRGALPQDLPVQVPTKFEFLVNLKVARALGLAIPPTLLATADRVIE